MKTYRVVVLANAKQDLKKYIGYLKHNKKNPQAAQNVLDDFRETRKELATVAGSLKIPDSELLQKKNLKRINFKRHDYFMLFRVEDDNKKVSITNIFHAREDFEKKLG